MITPKQPVCDPAKCYAKQRCGYPEKIDHLQALNSRICRYNAIYTIRNWNLVTGEQLRRNCSPEVWCSDSCYYRISLT